MKNYWKMLLLLLVCGMGGACETTEEVTAAFTEYSLPQHFYTEDSFDFPGLPAIRTSIISDPLTFSKLKSRYASLPKVDFGRYNLYIVRLVFPYGVSEVSEAHQIDDQRYLLDYTVPPRWGWTTMLSSLYRAYLLPKSLKQPIVIHLTHPFTPNEQEEVIEFRETEW